MRARFARALGVFGDRSHSLSWTRSSSEIVSFLGFADKLLSVKSVIRSVISDRDTRASTYRQTTKYSTSKLPLRVGLRGRVAG